ncbi:MAG: hypothetical protein DRN81_06955, partial [Thermoproteota archaeon]
MVIQHNTFYSNTAWINGGGIYIGAGSAYITATIVVTNSGGGIYNASTVTPALAYNDVWGNSPSNYTGVAASATDISTAPLFVNAPAGDFHLQAGSPCIDKVPSGYMLDSDYEGRGRPFGEKADIGASEFHTGTCFARIGTGRVYTSVQKVVDIAGEGDLIKVAGLCQGVVTRVVGIKTYSQTLYLSRTLTIRGGYTIANWSYYNRDVFHTILDAQGQGRVIYIPDSPLVSPTIEGLYIRGGYEGTGGGIYIGGGGAVVQYLKVYSNVATSGVEGGGGIYIAGGNPLIQHTDVFTNRATGGHGGGIYIKDGEPVIQYSHVYSCTA